MTVDWAPDRHSPHCTCTECLPVPRSTLTAFSERCKRVGALVLLDPLIDPPELTAWPPRFDGTADEPSTRGGVEPMAD